MIRKEIFVSIQVNMYSNVFQNDADLVICKQNLSAAFILDQSYYIYPKPIQKQLKKVRYFVLLHEFKLILRCLLICFVNYLDRSDVVAPCLKLFSVLHFPLA